MSVVVVEGEFEDGDDEDHFESQSGAGNDVFPAHGLDESFEHLWILMIII